MKLKLFPFGKSNYETWEEVFQNPRPINLVSFQTGSVVINRKGTVNPEHPGAVDVIDGEIEVPIIAHWIHNEEKGDFLLDAGLDVSYSHDPKGGLEGSVIDEFKQDVNENIAFYVSKHKINLKMVFLSHLHSDHAAGVRELPKNIHYIIAKGEYSEYQPEIHGDFLDGLEELYEIDFSHAPKMLPLGPSVDVLGDGSLWAILTPGHTPWHVSFLVNSMEGPILLTMDAAFIRENLELGVAPSDYTWNKEKAQETLEEIMEFLKKYPQVRVGSGHEILK